ncbi:MAG: DEDD exonuclease domain-containing protein [Actinomycetota bacterium]|nr:DEDD exonuclease domain-containing protein [Actinomycetota bacterium]
MAAQRSFEDLGTPLSEVTFCVVDLETTGGSPGDSAITEIGALKVRRGEVVGTLHTLVDPGQPVPAFIRLLTGITDELLAGAPKIDSVLPAFLEFARDSVVVAHNARFDVSFLNAALERLSYRPLNNRVVDTALLARKTLGGEVPNNKLSTLARHLRCAHQPSHRAYTDALATTDLLHHLIERATGFGVTTLENLLSFSYTKMDGTLAKIGLTQGLPRAPGIYRFVGATGKTLYVGKAGDIRSRVRSYFYGDPRRKIRDLLRETEAITFETNLCSLEIDVAEARAIAVESPPYNRAGKKRSPWYLRIESTPSPKISTARVPRPKGGFYYGPFGSRRIAVTIIDVFQSATRVHRCTSLKRCGESAHDQIGSCAGADPRRQLAELRGAIAALCGNPQPLYSVLSDRLRRLAAQQRFEEAAELRSAAELFERLLLRTAEVNALVAAGEIHLDVGGRRVVIEDGCLVSDRPHEQSEKSSSLTIASGAISLSTHIEARAICAWIRRHAVDARLLRVAKPWALPVGAGPDGRFSPKPARQPAVLDTSTSLSSAVAASPESID